MRSRRGRLPSGELRVFDLDIAGERLVVVSMPSSHENAAGSRLSSAERAVALDAAAGMSNAVIARRRRRSPRTIANQLASVYRKLGVSSRTELAIRLHALGRR